MSTDNTQQTALIFCEECGAMNFLNAEMTLDIKGEIGYWCEVCGYFNLASLAQVGVCSSLSKMQKADVATRSKTI